MGAHRKLYLNKILLLPPISKTSEKDLCPFWDNIWWARSTLTLCPTDSLQLVPRSPLSGSLGSHVPGLAWA